MYTHTHTLTHTPTPPPTTNTHSCFSPSKLSKFWLQNANLTTWHPCFKTPQWLPTPRGLSRLLSMAFKGTELALRARRWGGTGVSSLESSLCGAGLDHSGGGDTVLGRPRQTPSQSISQGRPSPAAPSLSRVITPGTHSLSLWHHYLSKGVPKQSHSALPGWHPPTAPHSLHFMAGPTAPQLLASVSASPR